MNFGIYLINGYINYINYINGYINYIKNIYKNLFIVIINYNKREFHKNVN